MNKTIFISASEVAQELGISKAHAYKIVQIWNKELKSQGFLVIAGRVNRQYYQDKLYGSMNNERKERKNIASI